ncbi:hypothetical protein GWC95_00555 [Sediminibacterium roseum]|uniref:Uncharacterized protein n=1 Tax=Sediminibacterium roseum TaxID=1978412 RepID=A0ABW9ZPD9_9BACT|nr:hypothetical protein [Sediminibacterium roseum]NCI48390.1 hypothetical protein [Sediminibacterium roseum]
MSGFPILDLVVGIIFVYFLLSIVSSSMIEIVMTATKLRGKMLRDWLLNIFDKDVTVGSKKIKLGQAIMDHCGTTALSPRGVAPSYIDAKNFTAALLEKVLHDPNDPNSIPSDIDGVIAGLKKTDALPDEVKGILIGYALETKDTYKSLSLKISGELEMFNKKIENWYDTNMERVSGALKTRHTRKFTLWIAIVLVVLLNADSISISKYLYKNPEARMELATQAYASANSDSVKAQVQGIIDRNNKRKAETEAARASADTAKSNSAGPDAAQKATDTLSMKQLTDSISTQIVTIKSTKAILDDAIPLGWNNHVFLTAENRFSIWLVLSKIAGLGMTVLAIMMGAPFWFDVLNKVSNMRSAGSKPPSSTNTK